MKAPGQLQAVHRDPPACRHQSPAQGAGRVSAGGKRGQMQTLGRIRLLPALEGAEAAGGEDGGRLQGQLTGG